MKDNLSIGGIAKIVNKSKNVVHDILKILMIIDRLKQESLQVGQE